MLRVIVLLLLKHWKRVGLDFKDRFIRAEVIEWQKLLEAGSWAKAKQKGAMRLEGKDYVAQDGDVMEIRHG